MLEEKIINNFPNYTINKDGVIKNIKKGNTIKSYINKGYYKVFLYNKSGRKVIYLHRLIAQAFIKNDNERYDKVIHLNANKLDNRIENLMWWYTSNYKRPIENNPTLGKLSNENAEQIRQYYFNSIYTVEQLSKKYKVRISSIYSIIKNKTHKCIYDDNEYRIKYNKDYIEKIKQEKRDYRKYMLQKQKQELKLKTVNLIKNQKNKEKIYKEKLAQQKKINTKLLIEQNKLERLIANEDKEIKRELVKKEPKEKKVLKQKQNQTELQEVKLTIEQAEVIRKLYKSKTKTINQLATEYNVSKTQINDIINNIILKPLKKGSVREYWVQRRNRFLEETTK